MPQEVTNAAQVHPPRPLFLTVLCVLGFIGSITSIVVNAIGFFNAETEVVQIKSGTQKTQLRNLFGKADASQLSLSNLTPENFQKFSVGGIVSALLCLIGVALMWNFKKSGYYSYVLGTFFTLITHFLLFGEEVGAMSLSLIWALIQLLIVILLSRFLSAMDRD
ncbi:hypothetical protein QWZ08_04645 [Ferruginibacter paludis]|uniref:hypothetical protein n=1 Tax=Ferruginibacter TaxID=1004303 RepID=UPI0025B43199|nr:MULTISPECIES: hypothetical protein [Ferruginibacter]MDB5277595.1 hypothetical protein [Ferruginibacter sp.]MDN3654905.1 hypothetical protein [Ferruginibacter paludis]